MDPQVTQTLLVLVGPPGSGKTHLSEQFAARQHFSHVNSDTVRSRYFPDPQFTPEERARVYQKIHDVITDLLAQGKDVIFDGNLLTNNTRFEALQHYHTQGFTVLFAYLDVPKALAVRRAVARRSSADGLYNEMPQERALNMHATFEPLDARLPQVSINPDNYAQAEGRIVAALRDLQYGKL